MHVSLLWCAYICQDFRQTLSLTHSWKSVSMACGHRGTIGSTATPTPPPPILPFVSIAKPIGKGDFQFRSYSNMLPNDMSEASFVFVHLLPGNRV